jgi:hypothetical protein
MNTEDWQNVVAGTMLFRAVMAFFGRLFWKLKDKGKDPPPVDTTVVVETEKTMHRTSLRGAKLSDREAAIVYKSTCPDCGHHPLAEGPHGGLSVNVYCHNEECGSCFNMMDIFGVERISIASPKRQVLPQPPYPTYRH